jgi:hypothetical protein
MSCGVYVSVRLAVSCGSVLGRQQLAVRGVQCWLRVPSRVDVVCAVSCDLSGWQVRGGGRVDVQRLHCCGGFSMCCRVRLWHGQPVCGGQVLYRRHSAVHQLRRWLRVHGGRDVGNSAGESVSGGSLRAVRRDVVHGLHCCRGLGV